MENQNDGRLPLLGMSLTELQSLTTKLGEAKFRGQQLADWLYKRQVTEFSQMANLPAPFRARLQEQYTIGRELPLSSVTSQDGTRKYLFPAGAARTIETAMIPDAERRTLCISCQVGCRMGCAFCATGKQPWGGNLSTQSIVNQTISVDEASTLSNIVLMGMGEPMDNIDSVLAALTVLTAPWGLAMSPRRITVSTVGLKAGLQRFLNESGCNLAVSLHTPFDDERDELMPANRAFGIQELLSLLRRYNWWGQRKLSFEYVVLARQNDTPRHAEALAQLLRGIPCLVNLIGYHPHPASPFQRPSQVTLIQMRDHLNDLGIKTTIRASRGMDIGAACGLLSRTQRTS